MQSLKKIWEAIRNLIALGKQKQKRLSYFFFSISFKNYKANFACVQQNVNNETPQQTREFQDISFT